MLTAEENALLCKVEGDAPMGQMMRRYWIPACLSADLEIDGQPRRIRLFGEDLVAFRDTSGKVGILDENCPHRGASLVLGRNEDCGVRCLYHGWKMSTDGTILETPPEPDELNFRKRIRATAYSTHEAGGFVWTYMGPPELQPRFPDFEFTHYPTENTLIMPSREECNWAQCLEGVLDSAHTNYLHSNGVRPTNAAIPMTEYKPDATFDRPSNDGAPRIEAQNTAYGYRYAAIRKPSVDAEKNAYIRVTLFAAPFYALFPAPAGWIFGQAFVPIDDHHTMFYFFQCKRAGAMDAEERLQHQRVSGLVPGVDVDAEYRKIRTPQNGWLQNRAAMRAGESFSGMTGINNEDIAVQESMGKLYDRTKERLGTSDVAVIRMRRIMLDSVRAFMSDGSTPVGLREEVAWSRLQAEERMIPLGENWRIVGAFAGEPIAAGIGEE
jgi:phthalate 4,5-dioxygenase oxygenase subunit